MEIYMNELITESPYELNKDMKFIEEIDHGAFGKVIHVHENKKNADMAVKVINKNGAGIQLIKKMKEEVSILKKLNHNNIVKFYGYTETNNQLLIEMEYIKYGTLSRWMKNHHKISEEEASLIIGKVLSAVEYLHSMHICHRDIKPENIMMSKENDLASIKIIDFGLSAQHFNYLSQNDYCGTFIYMAPEQIEKKLYYYSVDIWSIGILMYMLLNNGKHPFYHKDDKRKDFIKKIKLAKLNFINKISYMAKHLMHKLCEPNPSWRYSASLAIKHPWITRNPNDDIPLTFNEILNRNNNKKNGHTLIMISIFLKGMDYQAFVLTTRQVFLGESQGQHH
jgi:serine/threonine protein kinase